MGPGPHCGYGADSVGGVVGADADGVGLYLVEHCLGVLKGLGIWQLPAVQGLTGLPGDDISPGDNLNVLHLLVGADVGIGYPAGANNCYP